LLNNKAVVPIDGTTLRTNDENNLFVFHEKYTRIKNEYIYIYIYPVSKIIKYASKFKQNIATDC